MTGHPDNRHPIFLFTHLIFRHPHLYESLLYQLFCQIQSSRRQ
jgi:hypothetical protein